MSNLEVVREASDRLSAQSWRFYYDDRQHVLRLTHYVVETRPTTRHKYRAEDSWDTYRRSGSNGETPPLPDDVSKEVIMKFVEGLSTSVGFPK